MVENTSGSSRRFRFRHALIPLALLIFGGAVWLLMIGLTAKPHVTKDWFEEMERVRIEAQPAAAADADGANGWDELAAALQRMVVIEEELTAAWVDATPDADDDERDVTEMLNTPATERSALAQRRLDELMARLADRGVLAAAARAARQPVFTMPYRRPDSPEGLLWDVRLDELPTLRALVRALDEAARRAADAGDWNAAAAHMETTLLIAHMLQRQATLIEHLVGMGAADVVAERAQQFAARVDAPEDGLAAVAAVLARHAEPPSIAAALNGEAMFLGEVVERTHTKGGMLILSELDTLGVGMNGSGPLGVPVPRAANAVGLAFASKQETLDTHARVRSLWLDAAATVDPTRRTELLAEVDGIVDRQALTWRQPLLGMLLPSMGRVIERRVEHQAALLDARLAVASARYELAHGRAPSDAAALTPTFLDTAPIDPRTGEPAALPTVRPNADADGEEGGDG
jgi:hypothetical protein